MTRMTLCLLSILCAGLLAFASGCSDSGGGGGSDSDSDSDSDGDTDSDTDTDTDTDTDADTDTDTDTDTETDSCTGGVWEGNHDIDGEDAADEIAELEGYTGISGFLTIALTDLVDLNGLECIASIDGYLSIDENPALQSLDGLGRLEGIGHYLSIQLNPSLTSVAGLSALDHVDADLVISNNAALPNLDGLDAFATVGESVSIHENDALENLDGLGLTSVTYFLNVFGNDSLPGCEVCELVDQLTVGPSDVNAHTNLDDSCTPVPENCP